MGGWECLEVVGRGGGLLGGCGWVGGGAGGPSSHLPGSTGAGAPIATPSSTLLQVEVGWITFGELVKFM